MTFGNRRGCIKYGIETWDWMTLIYRVVAASTGTSCCWGGCNEPAHFDGHMMSNDRCCWMLLDAAECGGEEKPRQTMAENSDAGNCWSSTAEWLSIRRVFCVVDRRAAAMMRSMKLLEQQQQHLRGGCDRWWTIYWNQPQPLFFRCRSTVFSHLYCFVLFCRLIGWLICQHFQKNKRKKEKKKKLKNTIRKKTETFKNLEEFQRVFGWHLDQNRNMGYCNMYCKDEGSAGKIWAMNLGKSTTQAVNKRWELPIECNV